MKKKHRAFSLLEMLTIVAALVVMMALLAKPMRTMIADMPRGFRDYQTWAQTLDMLDTLQQDIEQSQQMLVFEMDPRISNSLLYLESQEGLISYTLTDGKVTRQANLSGQDSSLVWDLPHVKINWQFWQHSQHPYAIEITTWSQRTVLGHSQEQFKQTHVYFQKSRSINP